MILRQDCRFSMAFHRKQLNGFAAHDYFTHLSFHSICKFFYSFTSVVFRILCCSALMKQWNWIRNTWMSSLFWLLSFACLFTPLKRSVCESFAISSLRFLFRILSCSVCFACSQCPVDAYHSWYVTSKTK